MDSELNAVGYCWGLPDLWPRIESCQVIDCLILKGTLGCQPLSSSTLHDMSSVFILHIPRHDVLSCLTKSSKVKPVVDPEGLNYESKETSSFYLFINSVLVCYSVLFCCSLFLNLKLTNTFTLDSCFQGKKGYRIYLNSSWY